MMHDDILISVVMPAYNASAYIDAAIRSVLHQTWEKWELIIVDDGSIDDTFHIAKTYSVNDERIHVYHQINQGGCAARNEALKHISGEYVLFLDADDLLDKDKLIAHMRVIIGQNYSSEEVTFGTCMRLLTSGEYVPSSMAHLCRNYQPAIDAQVAIWEEHFNSFPYSSYLIPKSLIQKVGIWDERLRRSQDSEYMARVLSQASVLRFVPEAVFYYRQVPNSVSARQLTNEQIISEAIVCDKISDLILAAESSQQAKHACEVHYTDVLTAWYPQNRFIVRQMHQAMRSRGLQLNFENRGKLFHLLYRFLGWRFATQIMRIKQRLLWI